MCEAGRLPERLKNDTRLPEKLKNETSTHGDTRKKGNQVIIRHNTGMQSVMQFFCDRNIDVISDNVGMGSALSLKAALTSIRNGAEPTSREAHE